MQQSPDTSVKNILNKSRRLHAQSDNLSISLCGLNSWVNHMLSGEAPATQELNTEMAALSRYTKYNLGELVGGALRVTEDNYAKSSQTHTDIRSLEERFKRHGGHLLGICQDVNNALNAIDTTLSALGYEGEITVADADTALSNTEAPQNLAYTTMYNELEAALKGLAAFAQNLSVRLDALHGVEGTQAINRLANRGIS